MAEYCVFRVLNDRGKRGHPRNKDIIQACKDIRVETHAELKKSTENGMVGRHDPMTSIIVSELRNLIIIVKRFYWPEGRPEKQCKELLAIAISCLFQKTLIKHCQLLH